MVEEATKYLDKTEIEGFGGNLILYKRPDLDAVTWHYRAKMVGTRKTKNFLPNKLFG